VLEVGGLQPFSLSDWPGRLCAVVFVQGCPWRCGYCHNPGLQSRERTSDAPAWPEVLDLLHRRQGLLDGVVFSGGEPTLDGALHDAIDETRALGFRIGLHTAGIYPRRLESLLPRLDWIGLDLKTERTRYRALTGAARAGTAAAQALRLVATSGVPFEIRTTYDGAQLADDALFAMAGQLRESGIDRWVLQRQRHASTTGDRAFRFAAPPPPGVIDRLGGLGLAIELR
jgi:pyruvate formate lyase activating enzyme